MDRQWPWSLAPLPLTTISLLQSGSMADGGQSDSETEDGRMEVDDLHHHLPPLHPSAAAAAAPHPHFPLFSNGQIQSSGNSVRSKKRKACDMFVSACLASPSSFPSP